MNGALRHRLGGRRWILALALGALLAAPALAQPRPAARSGHAGAEGANLGDCSRCHDCAHPSALDPCLREPCTRHARIQAVRDAVPDSMLLDALAKDYEPVPFSHKAHADMADMGLGCATCHHHSELGEPPPACITCHDPAVEGTDPRMPGLKGAYHQQCLNCHREWMDENACSICHLPRAQASAGDAKAQPPTSGDILGRMHPPIPAPAGDFYSRRGASGDLVLFRHKDHVERFGLACVDCHHEPSCARCHAEANAARAERTVHEHHRPCLGCHKSEMDLDGRSQDRCARCHLGKDGRAPARFRHESVGWPLASYHRRAACRDCHVELPYARLDTQCTSCHSGWEEGRFDHKVTRQILDDTHADLACADCHKERRYELPPDCTDCHAPEDGVAFPAQRPGPQVGAAR